MEQTGCCLTVWFEEPFWVGMFQLTDGGRLSVAKVVFGAEPKDYEVYAFVLRHYDKLIFSPAVEAVVKAMPRSPKRQLRDAKKQLEHRGAGTRSQQALKMQQEQGKAERKAHHRLQKEAEEQRRFAMKQRKRKDKHRGHGDPGQGRAFPPRDKKARPDRARHSHGKAAVLGSGAAACCMQLYGSCRSSVKTMASASLLVLPYMTCRVFW